MVSLVAVAYSDTMHSGLIGRAPGDVFFVQQLFHLIRQLMRAEAAEVGKPRRVALQRGVGQLLGEIAVVEPVEFEREE